MNKATSFLAWLFVITSFVSNAQDSQHIPTQPVSPKLIAVVNRANWCSVCKANGQRFGALIMPYTSKGLHLYMNDLTNDSTKAASKLELEQATIYEAVTTVPRKGMGKMLKSCGIIKDKKQSSAASGIVIFINPRTHKRLTELSIASSDEEMKSIIEKYLN